jgi:predicted nucleic acid-binding protein
LINDLGTGETEVLMLGLELEAIVILDDGLARRVVEAVGLKFTGTLGR